MPIKELLQATDASEEQIILSLREALQQENGCLNLTHTRITPRVVSLLANCLKGNTNLTDLNIRGLKLGDEWGIVLASALENSKLKKLDVSNNTLGVPATKAFAKLLTKNKYLKTLEMALNPLGDEGVIEITQALTVNKSLTELDLASTLMTDKSAIHLADNLKSNLQLRDLHVNSNRIGDEGAKAIASALEINKTLKNLTLDDNREISNKGIDVLLDALERNVSLQHLGIALGLGGKPILEFGGEHRNRLTAYLDRNRKLADDQRRKLFSKKLTKITPLNKDVTSLITQYIEVLPKIEIEEEPQIESPSLAPVSLFDKFKNGIHTLYTAFVKFLSALKRLFSKKEEPKSVLTTPEAPSATVALPKTASAEVRANVPSSPSTDLSALKLRI